MYVGMYVYYELPDGRTGKAEIRDTGANLGGDCQDDGGHYKSFFFLLIS